MKNRFILFTALTMTLILCVFSLSLRAKEEKELIFGLALSPMITAASLSSGATFGGGAARQRELIDMASEEVKKLYGYTVTLKIYPSPKFLYQDFQKGKADLAGLGLNGYLYAKNNGVPVAPILAWDAGKWCFWVRKDSGIKNVKQLKGKILVHDIPLFLSRKDDMPPKESYFYWILIKKLLQKNGVDKPFKEFFKELKVLPVEWINVGYSVAFRKFDVFADYQNSIEGFKNYDKWFDDLVPLPGCLEISSSSHLIVHRRDLDTEIVNLTKKVFLNPPKTKVVGKLKKELVFKFVPVTEKDFNVFFQWLKEAEQKGWIKEFDEIMKNTPKPGEKKKSPYILEKQQ